MTTITLLHQTFNCSPQAKQDIETYITDIKDRVSHSDHYDESVIEDIMIACEHKFSTIIAQKADQTITEDDVRTVISQLGTPEFLDEQEHTTQTDRSLPRKLYRNGEKARIGGVASGLAIYFSMPIWAMRLIFVLLIATPLSSVVIYLILRYLLPETQTKGDTLRMHGKPVNLHSLTNTDNYIRNRVLSLLKTLLIIGGVILGGILSLATFVIVMGSIRQEDTIDYVYQCQDGTNATLTEIYQDPSKIRLDNPTIGGRYRYKPGAQPGEWRSDNLNITIQQSNNKNNLTITQSGSVIHENCILGHIYDSNGNSKFVDMGSEENHALPEASLSGTTQSGNIHE